MKYYIYKHDGHGYDFDKLRMPQHVETGEKNYVVFSFKD